ncbi:armadillo-type protein [Entophlyctis helioformis]|nr:armadillo-type protein [Entophlyctis helioformis]
MDAIASPLSTLASTVQPDLLAPLCPPSPIATMNDEIEAALDAAMASVLKEPHSQTYFEEFEHFQAEVQQFWAAADDLGDRLWWTDKPSYGMRLERLLQTVDKYQEQPQLLDPHLEAMTAPIVPRLLAGIKAFPSMSEQEQRAHLEQTSPFYAILYRLCKTRGYKVADLEPCLDFLVASNDASTARHWQTRYVTLLWASLVSMVPFDLARVDSGRPGDEPLMFLSSAGKEYEGSAVLLMRLLTRKDTAQTHLIPFINWAFSNFDQTDDIFKIRGLLAVLCALYKYGPRGLLLPTVHHVRTCCTLIADPKINKNALLRKQVVKLAQRIALCSLKPRVAVWRYQRGSRSLAENLGSVPSRTLATSSTVSAPAPFAGVGAGGLVAAAPDAKSSGGTGIADLQTLNDDEDDVPEEMEDIIGILLEGLRDTDTIVRWTSAKGVGRIANRLNYELADEIVGSVIDMLAEDVVLDETAGASGPLSASIAGTSDATWHGALLALAELTRRGLLLAPRLAQCMPWVLRGLSFDQRKGSHSIGAPVRDAACYVCWSFARAYSAQDLMPYIADLSSRLVVSSVTDREVNIRRASAAAFQENVGRHGLFPHGIPIIGIADYFTIGNRNNTFMEIAPAVAKFPEYARPIMDHIATFCLPHWDKNMRALAAKSLGVLATIHPAYIRSTVLPKTVAWIKSDELEIRHGSLMATAEIIRGLAESSGSTWGDKDLANIVVPAVMSIASFFPTHTETFGSDLTRAGASLLAGALAESGAFGAFLASPATAASVSSQLLNDWWRLLDTSLERSEEHVQLESALAVSRMCSVGTGLSPERLQSYLAGLVHTADKHRRRGVALALGYMQLSTLAPSIEPAISALCLASRVHKDAVYNDAESRRNAVQALTRIVQTLGDALLDADVVPPECVARIIATLLVGMEDYSTDSRGDVGSWVRDASIHGIEALLNAVSALEQHLPPSADLASSAITGETRRAMIGAICMQSVEKIDRIRETAGTALARLVWSPDHLQFPSKTELQTLIARDHEVNWLNPREVYPHMARLLQLPAYRLEVLTGFVVSVGGLTESLVRHSSAGLVDFLGTLPATSDQSQGHALTVSDVLDTVAELFRLYQRDDRVSIPLLELLDLLLSTGVVGPAVTASRHLVALFGFAKAEVLKSRHVKKLAVAIKVFTGFAGFVGHHEAAGVQRSALKQLVLYLAHPYPTVRRSVSESLYLLLTTALLHLDGETSATVEDLLLTTDWDATPVAELKTIRATIEAGLLSA